MPIDYRTSGLNARQSFAWNDSSPRGIVIVLGYDFSRTFTNGAHPLAGTGYEAYGRIADVNRIFAIDCGDATTYSCFRVP
jgi:hypothetical protein